MIFRIWYGHTIFENGDAYEYLLKEEIFISIEAKKRNGFQDIQLLKRNLNDEVESITIVTFAGYKAVKAFVGEDYEQAYVPEAAKKLLSRFDNKSQHYEVIHEGRYS